MNFSLRRARFGLRRLWFAAVLPAAGGAAVTPVAAEPVLSATSPFLPGSSVAANLGAAPEQYELAGASTTGKAAEICIYDAQQKRSHWIAVGTTEAGIQVVSYDSDRDQAVVRVNGAQKILSQRKANVASAGPAYLPAAVTYNSGSSYLEAAPKTESLPAVANPADAGKAPEILKQEKEARMLVSDLLEIGIQQRKAYEEAQRKAGKGG